MTTQTEDRSVWNCGNLVYTWNNEFASPPNCELHLSKCDPCGQEFCYWCSIGGQCFALKSQERDSWRDSANKNQMQKRMKLYLIIEGFRQLTVWAIDMEQAQYLAKRNGFSSPSIHRVVQERN